MKVTGLDGKIYTLNLYKHEGAKDYERQTSDLHDKAREIIKLVHPLDIIYEEVTLPGSNGLRADFFVPTADRIIEVHGRQHYERVSKFHANVSNFLKGKMRDRDKKRWCEINKIELVELPHDRIDEWECILRT